MIPPSFDRALTTNDIPLPPSRPSAPDDDDTHRAHTGPVVSGFIDELVPRPITFFSN